MRKNNDISSDTEARRVRTALLVVGLLAVIAAVNLAVTAATQGWLAAAQDLISMVSAQAAANYEGILGQALTDAVPAAASDTDRDEGDVPWDDPDVFPNADFDDRGALRNRSLILS